MRITSDRSATSTSNQRGADFEQFASERTDILRGLEVLAGLMGCFAAMEERPRLHGELEPRDFLRTAPVAPYWRGVKEDAA